MPAKSLIPTVFVSLVVPLAMGHPAQEAPRVPWAQLVRRLSA